MQNEEGSIYPMQNEDVESQSTNYYWVRRVTGEHQTTCRALLRFGAFYSKYNIFIMLAVLASFSPLLIELQICCPPGYFFFTSSSFCLKPQCLQIFLPGSLLTSSLKDVLDPIRYTSLGMGAVPEGKKRVKGKKWHLKKEWHKHFINRMKKLNI